MSTRCPLISAFLLLLSSCAFEPQGTAIGDDDGDTPDAAAPEVDAGEDVGGTACPAGYAPIGGSANLYRVVETNATWTEAASDCNDDDDLSPGRGHTHLVVVGSAEEKAALTGQFSGNTWVGLSDLASEGAFAWVTAEATGGFPVVGEQPPWDAGDPDGGASENCVRFKNSFDFEDKPCGDANSYVCECDRFAPP